MGLRQCKRKRIADLRVRKRGGKGSAGNVVFAVIVALTLFLTAAGLVGAFFAKNIVAPVMGYLGLVARDEAEAKAGGVPAEGNNTEVIVPGCSVYFLQTGAFGVESNAADAAARAVLQGGAGYTIRDGDTMRVILQGYADEKSAQQVKERLEKEKGIRTSIYSVVRQEIKTSIPGNKKQGAEFEGALALIKDGQSLLNEGALAAESGEVALEKISQGMRLYQNARERLEAAYPALGGGTAVEKLITCCNDVIALCEKTAEKKGTALISGARYLQVMAYHSYCSFLAAL